MRPVHIIALPIERVNAIKKDEPETESDVIFWLAEGMEALERLTSLQDYLRRNGALWVVFPKGKQHIKETDVIAAGKRAGLVDNKVVRFSDTHTALRLVIPLARR